MIKRTKKTQDEPVKREPFTYVHRGTVIEGKLSGVGRVRVHGDVRGDVEVDGVVEVAPHGTIQGSSVRAEELRVLGKVKADVVVSGKVEIWAGGELVGDVRAASLDIEEGARFTGRSDMTGSADRVEQPVGGVTGVLPRAEETSPQAAEDAPAVSQTASDGA